MEECGKKIKRKYNIEPPMWLKKLKPGTYDMSQLKQIVKYTDASIARIIVKYGAKVKIVDSGYRNLKKNLYIWKGLSDEKND